MSLMERHCGSLSSATKCAESSSSFFFFFYRLRRFDSNNTISYVLRFLDVRTIQLQLGLVDMNFYSIIILMVSNFSSVDSLITAIHPNAIPLKRHRQRWMC